MRKSGHSRVGRWIGNLLIVSGLIALGAWGLSVGIKASYQDWENWVFDRESHGLQAQPAEYVAEKKQQALAFLGKLGLPISTSSAVKTPPEKTIGAPIPANGLLGRMEVPRLGLTAMVREGTGEKTLSLAVGHIPGTALPGGPGNVAVAGHRDTFFRGLRNITKDDLIVFETLSGKYVYQVESTEIVTPDQISVLNASSYPQLTLVTCYPFYYIGSAPKRFIVKARQVPLHVTPAIIKAAAPVETLLKAQKPKQYESKVAFQVPLHHSRQLTPGISIGLTAIDPYDQRMDGWMWVMPERRTIWLRSQGAHDPVLFYGQGDGKKRELVITRVNGDSVSGYLLLPPVDSIDRTAENTGY